MLQLVRNGQRVDRNGERVDRLRVAAAHIEAAITHINNEAQTRVPGNARGDYRDVTSLRLLVVALGDIRTALKGERLMSDSAAVISGTEVACELNYDSV